MQSGDMRHLIAIQVKTETADGIGGVSLAWADSFSVFAKVVSMSGTERLEAQRLTGKTPVRFMVYYSTDITAEHRIKWSPDGTARYYAIRSVYDPNGQRRHMIIDTTEDTDS